MAQAGPYFSEIAKHLSSPAKADVSQVLPLELQKLQKAPKHTAYFPEKWSWALQRCTLENRLG